MGELSPSGHWKGWPVSTRSPHMQDCRSHSNRSGYLCSGSPQELAMPLVRWRMRLKWRYSLNSSKA